MPYIEAEERELLNPKIDELVGRLLRASSSLTSGEVNYCLSRIIWKLWRENSCYSAGNALMGVLECVKQEFYRRLLAPYEDGKRVQNGDVMEVGVE